MIEVAIADPFTLMRQAVRRSLETTDDIKLVAEATAVLQAARLVREHKPHVLLVEIANSERDGLDVIKDLLRLSGQTKVLIFTFETAPRTASWIMRAGAHGFLPKTVDSEALLGAIRAVHRGEMYVHPDFEKVFAQWHLRPAQGLPPDQKLSEREYQVMLHLAEGKKNREIAELLGISVKTVDTHRANLLKKLGLSNNAELTRFAIRNDYITA
jgi:DNA-binding NarL/FixJ family response regulator